MKLMVIGYATHGKDTVCNILRDLYDLTFVSSSFFVMERAVRPYLKKYGLNYNSAGDCYADRVNHRDKWFDAICAFNKNDPARLGRELFQQYDIYCGLRNVEEFRALKAEKAFDVCFWVDRCRHVGVEDKSSVTLNISHADYIIDNNGDLIDLKVNIMEIMDRAMDDGKIEIREPNFASI